MENLYQYAWQHKLWPYREARLVDGRSFELISPGILNRDSGPDFFNAKLKIGDEYWAGNVEIHTKASDWHRHGHDRDAAYDSVVLRAVHELNEKKGVTIILITHYMEEVVGADRVYVMDQGKVVMEGTPREIFSQVERLKKLRLDVPQVTLLAHELKEAGLNIPAGILTRQELVDALCR